MPKADETFVLEFDGGSRGNPGPAGIGVVVVLISSLPRARSSRRNG